jgi:hypothetical protein
LVPFSEVKNIVGGLVDFFGARGARARARGTRAHVRNISSSVLPKSTVQSSVHTYLQA